ncbi:MAG: hypothetical protein ACO3G4_13470, partial [Opitutaceae bacterium]
MRPAAVLLFPLVSLASGMTEAERRTHVDWMRTALPEVATWNAWQERTGALPPDFEALPSANFLPDPLCFHDGRAVKWPG